MRILLMIWVLSLIEDCVYATIDKVQLKNEVKDMFYHAYNSYMSNAFPADELMPLSCKGRYRGSEPSRGDIDDALGNFSLTLIDSLDTLVVLNDFDEFEKAVILLIKEVSFDTDVIVSVFETNIRILGGLLSGHILSEYIQEHFEKMSWYKGELLNLAKDIGYRLLPAFNTSTGIPHPRINLRHGLKSHPLENSRETCTACAGTMILEFAALSRMTGEPEFEKKAKKAMDSLWEFRHRSSDLVGTVLNIHNGDWVRRDSGVGAGIDSYYEYLLKAYILLGDEEYLLRFNTHYSAIMKYISQGPLLLDVHMHRPHANTKNFMDALLAFWPGLQVLKGDLKPAIETHEMLYQIIQKHNFLPEAFTTDFQVHWGQHPLRPEFVESTYLLYKATCDEYYLEAGIKVLKSLQNLARVPCGFAAVKDVRTGAHEDQMDSFVLSETFKYLYLLFSEPKDLILDLDDFLFTTEAHLLPLSLARLSNITAVPLQHYDDEESIDLDVEHDRSCPNTHYLFPGNHHYAKSIRAPLKNLVKDICPQRKAIKRRLRASEFQAGNSDHMNIVKDMGISMMGLPDGRIQLHHTASNAKTPEDAEEGMLFMQEMIELSRSQPEHTESPPCSVVLESEQGEQLDILVAGPAQFGSDLLIDQVVGKLSLTDPFKGCDQIYNEKDIFGKIAVLERGQCMFVEKVRRVEKAGALAAIIIDNNSESSAASSPIFAMSGDGNNDVKIPSVFLFGKEGHNLKEHLSQVSGLTAKIILKKDVSREAVKELSSPTTNVESKENILENIRASVKERLLLKVESKDLKDKLVRLRQSGSLFNGEQDIMKKIAELNFDIEDAPGSSSSSAPDTEHFREKSPLVFDDVNFFTISKKVHRKLSKTGNSKTALIDVDSILDGIYSHVDLLSTVSKVAKTLALPMHQVFNTDLLQKQVTHLLLEKFPHKTSLTIEYGTMVNSENSFLSELLTEEPEGHIKTVDIQLLSEKFKMLHPSEVLGFMVVLLNHKYRWLENIPIPKLYTSKQFIKCVFNKLYYYPDPKGCHSLLDYDFAEERDEIIDILSNLSSLFNGLGESEVEDLHKFLLLLLESLLIINVEEDYQRPSYKDILDYHLDFATSYILKHTHSDPSASDSSTNNKTEL